MIPTWFEIIIYGIFIIGLWWGFLKVVAAVVDTEEKRRENNNWEEL